jgi:hypothetical protein
MASSLDAKQMKQLLQSISTDPQLRQSKDSILLAKDQYPNALDAIITKLRTPTTLQNTISLLQWDRRIVAGYDAEIRAATIIVKIVCGPSISLCRQEITHGTHILLDSGSTLLPIYAYRPCRTH